MELNGAKILYTIHTNIPLLGDFKITQTLVSTWIVMALLSGLAIWLGHGLKLENVSKRQAAAEFIVTRLDQFVHDNMGYHFDQYIPLIGSIFALSIGCNLISVVGLWSPTADLNTEAAWAIVVFVLIMYYKIKTNGILSYLKGSAGPHLHHGTHQCAVGGVHPCQHGVPSLWQHPVRYGHLHTAVLGPGKPEPCALWLAARGAGPDPAVPDRHSGLYRPVFRLVRRLHPGVHFCTLTAIFIKRAAGEE